MRLKPSYTIRSSTRTIAMAPQPTLDTQGWYAPGLDFPYLSPNTFALVVNYRHGKFAVTPALQLAEGTTYGTPADVSGLDPRSCSVNQGSLGIPRQSATGRLYVVRTRGDQRRNEPGYPLYSQSADRHVRYVRRVPPALAVQSRRPDVVRFHAANLRDGSS